jgi:hypothetical protein
VDDVISEVDRLIARGAWFFSLYGRSDARVLGSACFRPKGGHVCIREHDHRHMVMPPVPTAAFKTIHGQFLLRIPVELLKQDPPADFAIDEERDQCSEHCGNQNEESDSEPERLEDVEVHALGVHDHGAHHRRAPRRA